LKKIGIIGGLAWPSTADYYRLICKKTNDHFESAGVKSPSPTPPMVIESLNINETRSARGVKGDEASWQNYDSIFREAFLRLKRAGADFGIIASNTPHMRLHSISDGLDFPIVSILDATAGAVVANGGKSALILGTPVTMRSDVYPMAMQNHGVEVLKPVSDEDIDQLDHLIDINLYQGRVEGGADQIVSVSKKYIRNSSNEIVCLACTELPLAFPQYTDVAFFEYQNLRFINTIAAHVYAVIAAALNE